VSYLSDALLDAELLPLRCFELLPGAAEGVDGGSQAAGGEAAAAGEGEGEGEGEVEVDAYMELDAAAMDNLEILQNSEGGLEGTLLKRLDNCVTGAGRRLLCRWLCRPLCHAGAIRRRQAAVATLREIARDAAGAARRRLRSAPDLERALARLHAATSGTGRNAAKVRETSIAIDVQPHRARGRRLACLDSCSYLEPSWLTSGVPVLSQVVLYEDHSRKRLLDFLAALKGLREVAAAAAEFDAVTELETASPRLAELTRAGSWERCGRGMSQLTPAVAAFEEAFDWAAAAASGRIVPRGAGVDVAWDSAQAAISDAQASLQAYLKQQREQLSCPSARFVNLNKDVYLLEVDRTCSNSPQR
jgi:DNA mismatch repair protein MSH6